MEWSLGSALILFFPLLVAALLLGAVVFVVSYWLCRRRATSRLVASAIGVVLVLVLWAVGYDMLPHALASSIYGP